MKEYFNEIRLASRNIEHIFEDIKDTAGNKPTAIVTTKFGGKRQVEQCIREILTSCDQIKQMPNVQAGITTQLQQEIVNLRGAVSEVTDTISKSQLENILEYCYSIRKRFEELQNALQPILLKESKTSTPMTIKTKPESLTPKQELSLLSTPTPMPDLKRAHFLSSIGHGLKAPLALMLGPLEEIMRTAEQQAASPESLQTSLFLIYRNTSQLLKGVNLLLDYAHVEEMEQTARYEPVALGVLSAGLSAVFRKAIVQSGLVLHVITAPLKEPVYVNRALWEQIVYGLLSNALKYTQQGTITTTFRRVDNSVEWSVADTGAGIAATDLPDLLELSPPEKHETQAHNKDGGLSLALIHRLIKLHGGSLRIESIQGTGSTFIITLPLGKQHLPPERVDEKPSPKEGKEEKSSPKLSAFAHLTLPQIKTPEPLRVTVSPPKTDYVGYVLYVEPQEDMRSYVEHLLIEDGWRVQTVSDGETALSLIEKELPDLVLSAVIMPGMGGFHFVKTLRTNLKARHLPVILLTARGEEAARLEGLRLGADDYLIKPFFAKELCMRIHVHFELGRLRAQLERTAENREQLLDGLCHELRNPLQGIYGNIQFLQSSLNEIEQLLTKAGVNGDTMDSVSLSLKGKLLAQLAQDKEALEAIDHCAKHQKSVTEDMLQLSKLDAKKVELNIESLKPRMVVDQIISILSAEIQRKQIKLSVQMQHLTAVQGDGHRLAQILLNLLSNAVKFTPQGGSIQIEVQELSADEKQVVLQFSIQDSGIGMTPEEMKRLFDRFSQANRKTYEQYGGTGLGLVISKQLVELMSGQIEVESEKGRGSRFRFIIVCQPAPELSVQSQSAQEFPSPALAETKKPPRPQQTGQKVKKLHVLIVEDNVINQKLLARQLTQAGYLCSVANNGKEALQMLEEKAKTLQKAKPKVDIILMDIEMPEMNGLEATRARRQQEQSQGWPAIPIVGVSGNAGDKHRQAAMEAGMNDYLTKPYSQKRLKAAIKQYTTSSTLPSKEAPLHADYWPSPPLLPTSIVTTTPTVQARVLPDRSPRSFGATSQALDSKTQTATPPQLKRLTKSRSWDAHSRPRPLPPSEEPRAHNNHLVAPLAREAEALLANLIR